MKSSIFLFVTLTLSTGAFSYETISYPSGDSLLITADLYQTHPAGAPFIILFHQAGFSRGEYREIAPRLNDLGFNILAVDQRSGEAVNDVGNRTAERAAALNLDDSYIAALPDLLASIKYVRENLAEGTVIIWGSSYSAALVLKIGGDYPDLMDGIIAFSPGEYFQNLGKSETFITEGAGNIQDPVFITSAKNEKDRWWSIYEKIPSEKEFFLPDSAGIHGSRALWKTTPESPDYWKALKKYLARFSSERRPEPPSNLREIK